MMVLREKESVVDQAQGFRFDQVVTTRRIVLAGALLVFLSLVALGLSTATEATPAPWDTDLPAAALVARAHSKPLVVLLAPEASPICSVLEKELASLPATSALRGAVRVRAEASQYRDLPGTAEAPGLPTVLVFSAESGYMRPIFQHSGALDEQQLLALARQLDATDSPDGLAFARR
jgi:hypothetical protein